MDVLDARSRKEIERFNNSDLNELKSKKGFPIVIAEDDRKLVKAYFRSKNFNVSIGKVIFADNYGLTINLR
jgi:hypothetical protein